MIHEYSNTNPVHNLNSKDKKKATRIHQIINHYSNDIQTFIARWTKNKNLIRIY